MDELISIIIPVYNVESYLQKCLDSIINQTYKNIEIIIIDDGSTDKSFEICDNYKLLDNRIEVVHKQNGGLSDARNYGLEIATGQYISFVDSDDVIHPQMIEILYKMIKLTSSDISLCGYTEFMSNNFMNKTRINNLFRVLNNEEALNWLYDSTQKSILMTVSWNKLYKKELFSNIRFPCGLIHEDEFTTYKLIYKAKRIVYVENELYYYRQRNNSIMSNKNDIKHLLYYDARIEQIKFFKKNSLVNLSEKAIYKIEFLMIQKYKESNNDVKRILAKKYLNLYLTMIFTLPIKYLLRQSYILYKMILGKKL